MKTEKEIRKAIKISKKRYDLLLKKGGFCTIINSLMVSGHIMALEWVLGEDNFTKELMEKAKSYTKN